MMMMMMIMMMTTTMMMMIIIDMRFTRFRCASIVRKDPHVLHAANRFIFLWRCVTCAGAQGLCGDQIRGVLVQVLKDFVVIKYVGA